MLLLKRNAFHVLDFGLHVVYQVRVLDIQADGLTISNLYKDLHG
jgi:hypothetical protein